MGAQGKETFTERVLRVVEQIPRGCVSTYGQVAMVMGSPRSARYVGFALRRNPRPGEICCHRVVFSDGRLSPGYVFGGPGAQRRLLVEEGVTFLDEDHVDMEACRWLPGCDADGRPEGIDWEAEMREE